MGALWALRVCVLTVWFTKGCGLPVGGTTESQNDELQRVREFLLQQDADGGCNKTGLASTPEACETLNKTTMTLGEETGKDPLVTLQPLVTSSTAIRTSAASSGLPVGGTKSQDDELQRDYNTTGLTSSTSPATTPP